MYEKIQEPIEVLAGFKEGSLRPYLFRWQGREYRIKEVNFMHSAREGKSILFYFSVSNDNNYFKLCFNSQDLNWKLEEMYTEG